MPTVKVNAKIVEDNTGVASHVPVLLTDQGELSPLTDYLLTLDAASATKIDTVVRATQKLISYMEANSDAFDDPRLLFQTFCKRLYSGTVGEDGLDPSGLYWIPASEGEVGKQISALSQFTDWLADKQGTTRLNPLRKATPHEERLNYAAWHRRNQNDFLGHIKAKDKEVGAAAKKARDIKGRTPLAATDDDAIAFPDAKFESFFMHGMGGATDLRAVLRDKLILTLMHGGGMRPSEALLPWVTDVFEDPSDPDNAIVRIYEERGGKAPNGWRGRNGETTRKAYLQEEYARIPRRDMKGTTQWLGFKSKVVDHKDKYMQVHWFPTEFGRVFMALWRQYMKFRAVTDAYHPYAFVAFKEGHVGNPYTRGAFNDSYANGLRRIGLEPSKPEGLDPHGHRHNYGRRLERAGCSSMIIKKALHHSSLESQVRYTSLGVDDTTRALEAATELLAQSDSQVQAPDWQTLVQHGFDDIDPQGYFTGQHPKLGRQ